MATFRRYLFRETTSTFSAICLVLLAIILSFRLAYLFDSASAGQIALSSVGHIIFLQSIRLLEAIMPIAAVVACALVIGKFCANQEFYAALACGVSRKTILSSLYSLTLPVALASAALALFVLPNIYREQERALSLSRDAAALLVPTPGSFRQIDPETVLYAQDIHLAQMQSVFIFRSYPQGGGRIILADNGQVQAETVSPTRHLALGTGLELRWRAPEKLGDWALTRFESARIRLPDAPTVNISQRLRNRATLALGTTPPELAEWQHRLNDALALLIFTPLLPILAWVRPRQSAYARTLPIFVGFVVYSNLCQALSKAVERLKIAPFPGSLWLHAALLVLAWFLWRRAERRAGI